MRIIECQGDRDGHVAGCGRVSPNAVEIAPDRRDQEKQHAEVLKETATFIASPSASSATLPLRRRPQPAQLASLAGGRFRPSADVPPGIASIDFRAKAATKAPGNAHAMVTALQILLVIVGLLLIGGTVLNLSKHPHWVVRLWDFPRIPTAVVAAVVGIAYGAFFHGRWWDWLFLAGLAFVLGRQLYMIYPYTPLAPRRVKQTTRPPGDESLRLVMSNVLMENRKFELWHEVVRAADPDVIVAVETDAAWDAALRPLERDYPHVVRQVQDNYYGIVLLSRLEIEKSQVRFLVQGDIPSIHLTLRLRDGQRVCLHALHPRPPEPIRGQDSAPRDAELVLMGKEIGQHQRDEPTIVCGDLNDVAWSYTTQLFLRLSKLFDPRMGRGMYNSFNADSRLFRFPLDHVFHSDEFKLVGLRRLDHVGSDHFPMFIELSCQPEAAREVQPEPSERAADQEEAAEIVEQQAEREREGDEHGHVSETAAGRGNGRHE